MSCCSSPNDPAPATTPTDPAPGGSGTPPSGTPAADQPPASDPAGGGSGGGSGVVPPASPAPCVHCEITSETVMTQPANRARLDIGVGERVRVTFSLGAADWTLAGEGFLSATNGATITYRAPSTAQSVTLTATGGGCTSTITFNIVAPTGVRMEPIDRLHQQNRPNYGMHTRIYLQPDTVNFHNVEIVELEVGATASGIYACKNGVGHNPGTDPAACTQQVRAGFGTRLDAQDTVFSGYCAGNVAAGDGRIQHAIPWRYRLRGGTYRRLSTVNQIHTCTAAGVLRASKAQAAVQGNYGDATTGSIGGTPL